MEFPHIFLAANDKYAPMVAISIVSMCENTKSHLNIYVLDSDITEKNKELIKSLQTQYDFSIEFLFVNINEKFKGWACTEHTLNMYSRFLIPELKPNLKKALYLDCDIVVLGDINTLFQQNLENFIIGAVPEKDTSSYFNSGVLLMDCEKWRAENIFDKLQEVQKNGHVDMTWPDQNILNAFFLGKGYKILEKKFNLVAGEAHFRKFFKNPLAFLKLKKECIVRHFSGKIKPWQQKKKNSLFFKKWWEYYRKTPFYALKLF